MSSVENSIASELIRAFGSYFTFCVVTIILEISWNLHPHTSSLLAYRLFPLLFKGLFWLLCFPLIHSCLISLYLDLKLLYIVGLYCSLFWSHSLSYCKCTYLRVLIFPFLRKRASGTGEMIRESTYSGGDVGEGHNASFLSLSLFPV